MKAQHAAKPRSKNRQTRVAWGIKDVGGHSFLLDPIRADQLTRERLRSIERSLVERSTRMEAGAEQEQHAHVLHLSLAQVRQPKSPARASSGGSDRSARHTKRHAYTPARG